MRSFIFFVFCISILTAGCSKTKKSLFSELKKSGDLFYLAGEPFTGVAFEMFDKDNKQFEITFKNGIAKGPWKYFVMMKDTPVVILAAEGNIIKDCTKSQKRQFGLAKNEQFDKFVYDAFSHEIENLKKIEKGRQNREIIPDLILSICNGEIKTYNDEGKLTLNLVLQDGSIVGKGFYKEYYDNGELYLDISFVDGKRSGVSRRYYENGKLEIEEYYNDGILNGPYKQYYRNGLLNTEGAYKDGEPQGEMKESTEGLPNYLKELVVEFYDDISKGNFEGATKLATNDSRWMLDQLRTAYRENKDTSKFRSDFAMRKYDDAIIKGNYASVKIVGANNNILEQPLQKENGDWKVDFSFKKE